MSSNNSFITSGNSGCPHTRRALLAMNILGEPLKALYVLLPVILYKDLNVSTFQISLFFTIRPIFALLSFYWSSHLLFFKNKLLSNLMGAWILARLPFLFIPLFPSFVYLVFASICFQLFSKAEIPAWIEITKIKIPKKKREHLFSIYNILTFIESIFLSVLIGSSLDRDSTNWPILLFIGALVGLTTLYFQNKITISYSEAISKKRSSNKIITPLKICFSLMRSNVDFRRFQWGFLIGGSALMFMNPALTIYYTDILSLSYSNISIARFAFMGIGVTLATMIWKYYLDKFQINNLVGFVLLGFFFFSSLLMLAKLFPICFYLAFLVYGAAQAGSQLIWNLSGPIFAGQGDSLPFTNANILMLGIRGAIFPLLGGMLCNILGAVPILALGSTLLLVGVFYMMHQKEPLAINQIK